MIELDEDSFGLILLMLALAAAVPGVCSLAGLLILICAPQLVAGRPAPVFPQWIARRTLPGRQLRVTVPYLIAALRIAEKVIHQRRRKPGRAVARIIGVVFTLLSIFLVLVPVPFSNILPALTMTLISLAYLAEDRLFLTLGLLAGSAMIGVDMGIIACSVDGIRALTS